MLRPARHARFPQGVQALTGTRLSEQPIQRYFGVCCRASFVKKSGVACLMLSAHRRFAAKSSCVKRAHLGAAIVLNTASTAKAGHTVDALVQRLGCCHCCLSRSPDAVFSINR